MTNVQRISFSSFLLNASTVHIGEYFKQLLASIVEAGLAQSAHLPPTAVIPNRGKNQDTTLFVHLIIPLLFSSIVGLFICSYNI
jgi:hypothetical protein